MSEHAAASAEYQEIDETGLTVRNQAQLSRVQDLSPASFRETIAREQEMQTIMTDYVRTSMVAGHHYYSFNEGGKPALTKDGAFRICSLFKYIPGDVEVEVIREDNGHLTVISTAAIFNLDGVKIASSRGSASTRESKYAYRWVSENQVPADVDKATLKSRGGTNRSGGGSWKQYQLPNPDLADLENTIFKMSEKRATVGAVNKLPLVSELFAADPDDDTPAVAPRGSAKPPTAAKPAAQAPKPPEDAKELATVRESITGLLELKFGGDADEIKSFLKGRDPGVMPLDALVKMQGDLAAI